MGARLESKNIIVPSLVREQHLRMKGITKNVMVVGPYIHYAKSLLNAFEYDSIKKTLGKNFISISYSFDYECSCGI